MPVMKVPQSDVHIVGHGAGQGDGDRDPEHGVGHAQWIQVPEALEDKAGDQSPDERERGQHRIGEMCNGEDRSSRDDSESRALRDHPAKAQQKEILQQKLLCKRPDGVAPETFNELVNG